MKKLLTLATFAAASAAFAQDVPAPVAAPDVPAAVTAPAAPLAETAPGALCKIYQGGKNLKTPEQLEEFLSSATVIDQGYDTASLKFTGEKVARHGYSVVVWEGVFESPVAGEFIFTVTGFGQSDHQMSSRYGWLGFRPYFVLINGKGDKSRKQSTFTVDVKKGLNNVYIATGYLPGSRPLTIEYRLKNGTKGHLLTPKNLSHIVEAEEEKDVIFTENK